MKETLAIIYEILIRPLVEAINNHAANYGGGVVAGKDEDKSPTPDKAPRGRPKADNKTPAAEVTKEQVRTAIRAAVEKHNKGEELEALLKKKFKASGIADLKPADYAQALADITAMCEDDAQAPEKKKDPWDE